jgi:hypothetical protein
VSVYEFTVYVQFAADDEDEARHKLTDYLADPAVPCYAIGVQNYEPRTVADDDH